MIEELVQKMLDAFKLMAQRTDVLQDTHGNLSVRFGDQILIKPSGVPYADILPDSICQARLLENGSTAIAKDNGFRPSVDLVHHAMIYTKNPWIRSICHTHSPHVVAHAIMELPIDCCTTEQADYFGGPINCLKYKDLDSWGDITVGSWEKAVLLGHHGALTFADDPAKAVNLAIQLENVARKNFLAQALLIHRLPRLDTAEIVKWHERYNNVYGQR